MNTDIYGERLKRYEAAQKLLKLVESEIELCEYDLNRCFKTGDKVEIIHKESAIKGSVGVIERMGGNGFTVRIPGHGAPSFDWSWVRYIGDEKKK